MSMTIEKFCQGIHLMEEAVKVMDGCLTETTFAQYKELYDKNYKECFHTILAGDNSSAVFLTFFCRMACFTYEKYEDKGIEEAVFWDTFRDITYWCQNCHNEYGEYGIHEYEWFWRHINMTIFRLGRLEFELMEAPGEKNAGGYLIQKGEPILNVHIPQGEPLIWKECEASFQKAQEWFGKEWRFVCHSWLLFTGLRDLLPDTSNIIQFQKNFVLLEEDYGEQEGEWRIFGKVLENIQDYPEQTTLQRKAKAYLLDNKKLGSGFGIYL